MHRKIIILLILSFLLWPDFSAVAEDLNARLSGRILLAAEDKGEAWYVSAENNLRYFLGRPADALSVMRELGIGITGLNLEKIPPAVCGDKLECGGLDSDGDNLPDDFESAIGTDKIKIDTDNDGNSDYLELANYYNPDGAGKLAIDLDFALAHAGKIFLDVGKNGEAWYVNPEDNRRYFLGRPRDAFNLMRALGLGISNRDLSRIIAYTPDYIYADLERLIHDSVNRERTQAGLSQVEWNAGLAAAARRHSRDLAQENQALTGMFKSCSYPLIHHEGFVSGFYSHDRLRNSGIYYFSKSGENIALMPAAAFTYSFASQAEADRLVNDCGEKQVLFDFELNQNLDQAESEADSLSIIEAELARRGREFSREKGLNLANIEWDSQAEIAAETVAGWMESPGHRENILTADFDEAGIGVAYVNGYLISTQVFIKRAECGYQNGICCEKPGYYPYCFKGLECGENMICKEAG